MGEIGGRKRNGGKWYNYILIKKEQNIDKIMNMKGIVVNEMKGKKYQKIYII